MLQPILTALAITTALFYLLRYLGKSIRSWAIENLTALNELEDLGKPVPHGADKINGTVVIAGGSIAGLLVARVCADHFRDVLIVEPEAWLETEEGISVRVPEVQVKELDGASMNTYVNRRARLLQNLSIHTYQAFNLQALRKLFPNYDEEFEKGNVVQCIYNATFSGTPIRDAQEVYGKGRVPETVAVTRPTYEATLRQRVKRDCKGVVRFTVGSVTGINLGADCYSGDGHGRAKKITSVSYKEQGGEGRVQEASLVVDCTGPAHAGLKWLEKAGFGRLPVHQQYPPSGQQISINKLMVKYDPKMNYVTANIPITPDIQKEVLELRPEGRDNCVLIHAYISNALKDNRSMGIGFIEGGTVRMFAGGWGDVPRPSNASEFWDFIETLNADCPPPAWLRPFFDAVWKNEHLAVFEKVRVPPCAFVQYSKAVNMPSNFIAVGDSVMRVNPIFGQGCAKAMIGTLTLDSLLRSLRRSRGGTGGTSVDELPDNFGESFVKKHEAKVVPIWQDTKTQDYGHNSTVPIPGESKSDGKLVRWYSRNVLATATRDKHVASTFWSVLLFLAPPTDLFAPSVVVKVMWQALTSWATKLGGN